MISIRNVECVDGVRRDVAIGDVSDIPQIIDGTGLTLLPAVIDPHVHFRIPGASHKEDWKSGTRAALSGGVTAVFDMPNNTPSCTTLERLLEKKREVNGQLQDCVPVTPYFYMGSDRHCLQELTKVKGQVIGIKMFMGSSTGDLLIDDLATQAEVFKIAAEQDLLLAIHAEDDSIIRDNRKMIGSVDDCAVHSRIREPAAAIAAVERALKLAEQFGTRLAILHCSTAEELQAARQAKKRGLQVYVEACPRHLFLDETAYASQGMRVKVNPPLRSKEHQDALWDAIRDGTIDFVGSDHSPHTLEEKARPYDQAPAGAPGVEHTLPLMLDACHRGILSLQRVVELTHTNIEKIFRIKNNDWILVDRRLQRTIHDRESLSKVKWSPFHGMSLTGWPVMVLANGTIIELGELCLNKC
jgi:dihydroorotase